MTHGTKVFEHLEFGSNGENIVYQRDESGQWCKTIHGPGTPVTEVVPDPVKLSYLEAVYKTKQKSGQLQFVENPLSNRQIAKLLEIAHETKDPKLNEAALELARRNLFPPPMS